MDKNPDKYMKRRIIFLQGLIVLLIFILGAKSFDIHILKGPELAEKARNDYTKYLTIKGERGQILDRNLDKLATSIDTISISACPVKIKDPAGTAKKLSAVLGINPKKLQKKLTSRRMFTWVARNVSPAQADQIRNLKLGAIYFENDFKRFYPHRNLAAQVIGFTNLEDKGLEGLESKYNGILAGTSLKIKVNRDGNGRIFDLEKKRRSALKGDSIILTLDKKIQFITENILKKTVESHRAKSAMAIVMRPKTGEILSIAHYPEFNPNNFKRYKYSVFRNRSVTDAFEPGSVMKIFTAAAALEKGLTPKTIFNCEKGTYRIGSFTIHDTHPHEWLSINQIIKVSSNIGAVKIGETIGRKSLFHYLSAFGFGEKTGMGCPGETSGALSPYGKWSNIDAGAISFGQGVSVSAIQLITGISSIANGGNLMKPILIKKRISNTSGDEVVYHPETIRRVVSSKTARSVKKMMGLVVEKEGTGTKAAMDGYSVGGKTGTAQKAKSNGGGYKKGKYISVFTGFAPLDAPELAALVVVDEPTRKYYGGDVAAPAFKAIMAESFHYLNIPPKKDRQFFVSSSTGENQ